MEDGKEKGHLHPISITILEMYRIFSALGFAMADGPEIETEEYNFDKLNFPKEHPARDMQDTFWLGPQELLRTHTSAVQIRHTESHTPPIKIIVPGKVFRNEATDATHEFQFHQLEGMYINERVSFAELKGTLEHFIKEFFGDAFEVRFRSSFFPFTEPSVEVDISRDGKQWIEVLGAGMMHPNVIKSAGLDPKQWRGFAFGIGVDRMLMLKTGIDDVRMLYDGDLRVIHQF